MHEHGLASSALTPILQKVVDRVLRIGADFEFMENRLRNTATLVLPLGQRAFDETGYDLIC